MFGVKCGNMACVHTVLLSHCDNGRSVDHLSGMLSAAILPFCDEGPVSQRWFV
jgi:hypothetical protein